jgi:hypothetical protein
MPSCPGSAQRGLSDRKDNGTANHAKHAKGGGALQVHDYAFDLKARLAEVAQQAEMQACPSYRTTMRCCYETASPAFRSSSNKALS